MNDLIAAAKAVIAAAEPDIAYEGEGFVDYIVPFDAMDALRVALAASPSVTDTPDGASEYGRLLAERDRLIGQGVDPADLLVPNRPDPAS